MTQYYATAQSMPRYAAPRSGSRRSRVSAKDGQSSWRRNQNTTAFNLREGLGPVTSTVLVILLLSVLGLIYLTQITKTSNYGYQISELRQKRAALQEKKAALQVETARLQSLQRVKGSEVAKRMGEPAKTYFANQSRSW